MGGEKFRPVEDWFAWEGFVLVAAAGGVRDLYSVAALLGTMEILGTMERVDFVCDALEPELRPTLTISRLRAFFRNFVFFATVALIKLWIPLYVTVSSCCSNFIQQKLEPTILWDGGLDHR
jgi:hypothetical protein